MREAQAHDDLVALLDGLEADAGDVEVLAEALGDADDHVVDQRTGQAMEGAVLLLVGRAGDGDGRAFNADRDVGVDRLGERGLAALHRDDLAVDLDFDAGRDGDRHLAYSGHVVFPPALEIADAAA
ncbi:hypothetical protein SDC9_193394 [bioreactor metagenome]|uniref:Uncharacterized protein n=1 Tax=bioreactor metagenome TaxID=1076179 RepID=A0A645I4Y9_9ZZZZ